VKTWEVIGACLGCVGIVGVIAGAEFGQAARYAREKREAWEGPCADSATLVATSSGSPNTETCTNKRHKMRVQVTTISGNEVGAVVHCECHGELK
jgi:hypothetical protein